MTILMPTWVAMCWLAASAGPQPKDYFRIRVADGQTGRGVPMVELSTVNHIRYVTDSNGLIAFFEPGLMNRTVFFSVKSHGYEFPPDGFGFRGKSLKVSPGGHADLTLKRVNIAERLYRVTGEGIYRDSVLLDEPIPIREPLLNAQVMGSDSAMCALFQGKLHWFWGDTNRPRYPLGNFHVPGATSLPPADGGLDPARGVDLSYFVDGAGFARECAKMPGEGPTWIDGLVVLREANARERMFAAYVKVRKFLEVYRRGLVEFIPAKQGFEQIREFERGWPAYPHGHTFLHEVNGVTYVYFANPYPLVRVRATPDDLKDLGRYEAFSPLKPGTRLAKPALDRDDKGNLRYAWRRHTPAVGPAEQGKLIEGGQMTQAEALLQLRDVDTGAAVQAHAGSAYWNCYRRRWVLIAEQVGGSSSLGEIWYAEADTPVGPWVYARKIVTHDAYSFYNPTQHPEFDQQGGRVIYFEGTYSSLFSASTVQTPRYDYNQIMYRLDLADGRLALPVAFCQARADRAPLRLSAALGGPRDMPVRIAFFALDRPAPQAVPIYLRGTNEKSVTLTRTPPEAEGQARPRPAFYALPADVTKPPATSVELWEFVHKNGARRVYRTDRSASIPGFRIVERPLCRVWRNPIEIALRWE